MRATYEGLLKMRFSVHGFYFSHFTSQLIFLEKGKKSVVRKCYKKYYGVDTKLKFFVFSLTRSISGVSFTVDTLPFMFLRSIWY